MTTTPSERPDPIILTAEIVSAFVSNNSVPSSELPLLIESVRAAIVKISSTPAAPEPVEPPAPAVPIRKSITPDYLICLDDGRKFKSLRRHLASLGMTPEEYRAKWKLPNDYPMVAPNYSATRSALAKKLGLGQLRTVAAEVQVESVKRKAGRPRKATAA